MIAAGALNKRITLQQLVESRDGFGGVATAWQDVATVWAAVEPLQGREFWAQQQTQAEVTTRVRIRHRAGIAARTWRIAYAGRVLDIHSVIDPKERHEELQLMCTEGVTSG